MLDKPGSPEFGRIESQRLQDRSIKSNKSPAIFSPLRHVQLVSLLLQAPRRRSAHPAVFTLVRWKCKRPCDESRVESTTWPVLGDTREAWGISGIHMKSHTQPRRSVRQKTIISATNIPGGIKLIEGREEGCRRGGWGWMKVLACEPL